MIPPSRSSDSITRQVSPARPHPVSALMASARVYSTVSRSGEMCSPWRTVSSPVLTMAVIDAAGTTSTMPRRSLAAPTPPASATIIGSRRRGRGPPASRRLSAAPAVTTGRAPAPRAG